MDRLDAMAIHTVADMVRINVGDESHLPKVFRGLLVTREDLIPWVSQRLTAVAVSAPWFLPAVDPDSWVSTEAALQAMASGGQSAPDLLGKTKYATELATLDDRGTPKVGLDALRGIYLLGLTARGSKTGVKSAHLKLMAVHIRGLQRWRYSNPGSKIPPIRKLKTLSDVSLALDRHWATGDTPLAKAWREGWSPWLTRLSKQLEQPEIEELPDQPEVTSLLTSRIPGDDYGTCSDSDPDALNIVVPPPAASPRGVTPPPRPFLAAFAHQAIRSANRLLLKQHITVACDAEVEILLRHCHAYPYTTGGLDGAVDLAVLQLLIATGRNLATLLDTSISSEEPPNAAMLSLDIDSGLLSQPLLKPPNAFKPAVESAHAFEIPGTHFSLHLPPTLSKIIRTVHSRHGAKARRLLDWFDGRRPDDAIRSALRGIPGLSPTGRIPSRYRRWLASQLQEEGKDLVQTMLLTGDTHGRSIAPLYYHSPHAGSLTDLYRKSVWPLFNDDPARAQALSTDERVGPAHMPRIAVAHAGLRHLGYRLNESVAAVIQAGPTRIADFHNRFVDYLTHHICIVTSHRPSRSLYALTRNAFDLERHLCVSSDKRVDLAHVTRLCSTTPRLSAQIRGYLGHLEALAALSASPDELCRHIGKILKGKAPLLTYIDGSLTPRAGTEVEWTNSRPKHWACLPDNWYRTLVATRLRDLGAPADAVFCQLGHLESAGQPFGPDSPLSPILVMRSLRDGLATIEDELGVRVLKGFARGDYREVLPPLQNWDLRTQRHQDQERATRRAELEKLRATMKENRVRAVEWLRDHLPTVAPSAEGALMWISQHRRGFGKDTPFWRSQIKRADIQKLLRLVKIEFAGNPAVQVAIHNQLNRWLRSAVERLQVDADDIGLITPRPIAELSPFLEENCLATQQMAAVRRHLSEKSKCGAVIPEPVRVALALILYGHVTDPEWILQLLSEPVRKGSVPPHHGDQLIWRDDQGLPHGFGDLASIALSSLREPVAVICNEDLSRAMALQLPEDLVGNEPELTLYRLCATALVASRIEYSSLARAAIADASDASPAQQAAFFASQLPVSEKPTDIHHIDQIELSDRASASSSDTNHRERVEVGCWKRWAPLRRAVSDPMGVLARQASPTFRKRSKELTYSRDDIRRALDIAFPLPVDPQRCRLTISQALVTFARDMAINGTTQKADPAGSTISTYFSVIGPSLIQCFAGVNLRDLDSDDFEEGYRLVLEASSTVRSRQRAALQVRHFHAVLERVHAIGSIEWAWLAEYDFRSHDRANAELLSEAEYQLAVVWLRQQFSATSLHTPEQTGWRRLCFVSVVILVLLRRTGARINEVVRLRHNDLLDFGNRIALIVRPSRFRALKTRAARRLIDLTSRLTDDEKSLLRSWVHAKDGYHPRKNRGMQPFFPTLDDGSEFVGTDLVRKIIQTAFRAAAGREMWPHLLRHAWVTEQYPKAAGVDQESVDSDGVRGFHRVMTEAGHANSKAGIRSYLHTGWRFRRQPAEALIENESMRWLLSWVSGLRVDHVDKLLHRAKPAYRDKPIPRRWIDAVAIRSAPAPISVAGSSPACTSPNVAPRGGTFTLEQLDRLLALGGDEAGVRQLAPAVGISDARVDYLISACHWLAQDASYRLLAGKTRRNSTAREPLPRPIGLDFIAEVSKREWHHHAVDLSHLFVACYSPFEARHDRLVGPESQLAKLHDLIVASGLAAQLLNLHKAGSICSLSIVRVGKVSGFHRLVRMLALISIWPRAWQAT